MSQLLLRLENQLASSTDPLQAAELTARIAANLARVGRFEEANARIANLRQEYGDGSSGPVMAWIMLAEGLVHLYRDLSPAALDRLARAKLLGIAMSYTSFVGLAAAWKAHVEFELSKFPAMIDSLRTAIKSADLNDHDAWARIAMVLSNCHMLCGDFESAQKWFLTGRDHAIKNGDQASVEALLYNRAAFGLAWLRLKSCEREPQEEELRRTRSEVKSSRNLQDLTQVSALTNHIQLADARLLVLEGRYREAIDMFGAIRDRTPFANHNFSQSLIDLEIAFCRFRLGDFDAALNSYSKLNKVEFSALDLDEQVVAEWMTLQMSEADSRFGSVELSRKRLEDLLQRHRDFKEQLLESLSHLAVH